jgi:hypothetical protein
MSIYQTALVGKHQELAIHKVRRPGVVTCTPTPRAVRFEHIRTYMVAYASTANREAVLRQSKEASLGSLAPDCRNSQLETWGPRNAAKGYIGSQMFIE